MNLRTRAFSAIKRLQAALTVAGGFGMRLAGHMARPSLFGILMSLGLGAAMSSFLLSGFNGYVGNALAEDLVAERRADMQNGVRGFRPIARSDGSLDKKAAFEVLTDDAYIDSRYPKKGTDLSNADWVKFDGPIKSRTDGDITFATRYVLRKIPKAGSPVDVMKIEVRQYQSEHAVKIVADIGMRDPEEPNVWKKIPWWKTNNVARSNVLFEREIADYSSILGASIDFPTSMTSLITWVKSYWNMTTKRTATSKETDLYKASAKWGISDQDLAKTVGPMLERTAGADWQHVQTNVYVTLSRIANGFIQWCTIAFGFAALLVILARGIVFGWAEPFARGGEKIDELLRSKPSHAEVDERLDRLSNDYYQKWGEESATSNILKGAFKSLLKSKEPAEALQFLDSHTQLESEKRDSSGFFIRFLIAAIPAIGFIGTVWGIGQALMGTGSVLSDSLAKQQSGVSSVALKLGLAFDTTLVALLISLFVSKIFNYCLAAEERSLSSAKQVFLDILSRLSGEYRREHVAISAVPRAEGTDRPLLSKPKTAPRPTQAGSAILEERELIVPLQPRLSNMIISPLIRAALIMGMIAILVRILE